MRSSELLAWLDHLGIAHSTVAHASLRTVADSKRWRGTLAGGHVKNLFLRDKKGGYWLLVALEDTQIDLRRVAQLLDAPRLSFAKAEELDALLGIQPGAVSPLALVHDTARRVQVVLDAALFSISPLNFHPLRNDRTTAIASADLLTFLAATGHAPQILALAANAAPTP